MFVLPPVPDSENRAEYAILRRMNARRLLPVFLLLTLSLTSAFAQAAFVIRAQDWAMPRSAAHLTAFPPLAQAVAQLRLHPGARLLIHYPGGDEGTLWVNELRSWLVALGISSEQMELAPGSSQQSRIEIEVIARDGKPLGATDIQNKTEQTKSGKPEAR